MDRSTLPTTLPLPLILCAPASSPLLCFLNFSSFLTPLLVSSHYHFALLPPLLLQFTPNVHRGLSLFIAACSLAVRVFVFNRKLLI